MATQSIQSTAGRLNAAQVAINNTLADPEIQTVTAFDTANQRREAAKGAAQQATREQDATLKALNEWVGQYTRIAKVALRDKKQLLEKLGISARVSKTAAQRAAPRESRHRSPRHDHPRAASIRIRVRHCSGIAT